MTHDFVGYDANNAIIAGFQGAGTAIDRDFFKTRCDESNAYWELVRAGCGVGFGQLGLGRADPLVSEIAVDIPLPTLPIWLTAHEAMRQTPRIRRVWNY